MSVAKTNPGGLAGAGQGDFGRALLDPQGMLPEGVTGPDGAAAPKRFNVYRNNVVVSLCEALGKTFPAVRSLLGEDYFSALAREFVSRHPPSSPVLIWYGAAFPGFVSAFPPLEAYPYLADVARAEWAWLQAYHAEDAAPLDPAMLGAVAPEQVGTVRFERHPAASLVASRWPVFDLLRANRFEPEAGHRVDLEAPQPVLIVRPDFDVAVVPLGAATDVFLRLVFDGATLAEAAGEAQANHAEFSLSGCLSDCLSNGAFKSLLDDTTD
ncbi:MAG: DNA-binding domain-containing protein [Roseibium sp.]